MCGGSQENQGARRWMPAEITGKLDQRGYAGGLFGAGRQRGNHGHGIVVRLQDDGLLLELRTGPRDGPEDVPRRAPLPVHAVLDVHLDLASRAQGDPFPQADPLFPWHPEAGQVEGHGQELALPLQVHGRVRFDEHHPGGSEVGALEPGVAGVEVHQHHGVFDLLAVQPSIGAVAPVDQAGDPPAVGQRGGPDQVGPQAVQSGGFPRGGDPDAARGPFHRNGDVVLVDRNPVQPDLAEGFLDVTGSRAGSGISRDPGFLAGEVRQGPGYALLRDQVPDRGKVDLCSQRPGRQRGGIQKRQPAPGAGQWPGSESGEGHWGDSTHGSRQGAMDAAFFSLGCQVWNKYYV